MSENDNIKNCPSFYNKYKELISPIFSEMEEFRLKEIRKFKRITANIVILFILAYGMGIYFLNNKIASPGVICLFIGNAALVGLHVYYNYFIKEDYKNKLKLSLMQKFLNVIYPEIKWINHTEYHLGKDYVTKENELYNSGLFIYSENNCYRLDDEFIGDYKGIKFVISEGRKNYFPHAVIISFNFNKTVKNRTIICEKGEITQKHNFLSTTPFFLSLAISCVVLFLIYSLPIFSFLRQSENRFENLYLLLLAVLFVIAQYYYVKLTAKIRNQNEEPLNEVKLEDIKFIGRFKVYSSDQVESRYLITPAFMEKFYNLKIALNAKGIKCSFYDNKLMIAFKHKKDLFELGDLLTSLYDEKYIRDFYNQIISIFQIIDYFKLNEKTGL